MSMGMSMELHGSVANCAVRSYEGAVESLWMSMGVSKYRLGPARSEICSLISICSSCVGKAMFICLLSLITSPMALVA